MKLDIDGLLKGRDMGYSLRHPDTNRYIQTCVCEEAHCHLPGEDSEQRHYYACLMMAASEMYELLTRVATSTNSGYGSMMSAAALADTLRNLSSQAKQLLAKIEGGGE